MKKTLIEVSVCFHQCNPWQSYALEAPAPEMRHTEKLRGVRHDRSQHHPEAPDAFSGDHTTNSQFHLCCPQPSTHECSVFPQLGVSLQSRVQCSDLFATRIDRIGEPGTLPAVFTPEREWFIPIINSITRTGDAQREVVIIHRKDRLIEVADLLKHSFRQRKSGKNVRELEYVFERARTRLHGGVTKFALNLVPGASFKQHVAAGIDQRRVAAE